MELAPGDVEWVTCDSPVNIALIKYCMYLVQNANNYSWIFFLV